MNKAALITAMLGASFIAAGAEANDAPYDACKGAFTFTDSTATYEDFDFWVGDWQIVDTETGVLRGFDRVEMTLDGCVIKQQWTSMDDRYAASGGTNRLRGMSLTGVDPNGQWRQMWTDTSGTNYVLTGGLDESGAMVLTSNWITVKDRAGKPVQIRNIWHWLPKPDGTIHNWGFIQRDNEEGQKNKFFDITYHRSEKGGPTFVLKKPDE